jgi:predicted 2-oxoglutarate/Fe(II)-dependent dioxygenase YbiX
MPETLPEFLSPAEVLELRAMADAATAAWTPGRQHTGYDILALRPALHLASPLIGRAMARIGVPFEDYWDTYFIRYLDGAHIPPHTDPAQHGKAHRRINAILAQPAAGGELRIGGMTIPLAIGDAILFRPDRDVHEVTTVRGSRLLFSVGAWV